METDFEQRLREGLQARAAEVTPDPQTWERVREGIRRERRFRLLYAGAAGTAVAALAAVAVLVLPGVIDAPDVELGGTVADQPEPSPEQALPPAPGPEAVPSAPGWPELVLATDAGIARLGPGGVSPAGGPDDVAVDVVTVRPGAALDDLDAVYAAGCQLGRFTADPQGQAIDDLSATTPGACADGPRFAPDGEDLAWIESQGDSFSLRTVGWSQDGEVPVRNAGFALDLSVLGDAEVERLRVLDWVWTGFDGATSEGFVSLGSRDAAGANRVLSLAVERQADGAIALPDGERPTVLDDGDLRVYAYQHEGGVTWTLQDLEGRGLGLVRSDVDAQLPTLELPGAVLDPDAGPVWLEVDGDRAVFGDGLGSAWTTAWDPGTGEWSPLDGLGPEDLPGALRHAAALGAPEPVADLEPVGAPEAVEGAVPAPVTATRDAIRAAAEAGDLEALEALAGDVFTYSFGGAEQGPAAFWRQEMDNGVDVLGQLLAVLDLPPTQVEGGDITVWPFAYDRSFQSLSSAEVVALTEALGAEVLQTYEETDQYLGHRLGIRADGTWLYFVAGD